MTAAGAQISRQMDIQGRDVSFEMTSEKVPRYWFNNDPWSTQWMNALFSLVPVGERFICKTFRSQLDKIKDPSVKKATKGLIRQEALHAREHAVMNRSLTEGGIPIERAEAILGQVLDIFTEYMNDDTKLAFAAISEHFTAVLSEVMFENLDLWDDSQLDVAAMMYWHFVEETEHKSVAFDVLIDRRGHGVSTYALRLGAAAISLSLFLPLIHGSWLYFVWKDGQLSNIRSAMKAIKHFAISPGIVRQMFFVKALPYFRPNFHPWDIDNRKSIDAWKKTFEETGDPRAAFKALRDWHLNSGKHQAVGAGAAV